MRRPTSFILCAGLVACSGSSSDNPSDGGSNNTPGNACKANHTCDPGLVCDMTDPSGPVCISATGDLDGDGIPNDKDFCEHMAGGAHDEDGDGVGDECDKCPIAPPPSSPDSDGDDVEGTQCDPDTRTPGDKIALFNGFNDPIKNLPPAWQVKDGALLMTPLTIGNTEELEIPLPSSTSEVSVDIAFHVDSIAAGATAPSVGVFAKSVDLPMGVYLNRCGGARIGGADSDQIVMQTEMTASTAALLGQFDPASLYRITLRLDKGNADCVMIINNDANRSAPTTQQIAGAAMTRIGLYAKDATIRFSYVLVVSR